jgi:hypothetical protein
MNELHFLQENSIKTVLELDSSLSFTLLPLVREKKSLFFNQ